MLTHAPAAVAAGVHGAGQGLRDTLLQRQDAAQCCALNFERVTGACTAGFGST